MVKSKIMLQALKMDAPHLNDNLTRIIVSLVWAKKVSLAAICLVAGSASFGIHVSMYRVPVPTYRIIERLYAQLCSVYTTSPPPPKNVDRLISEYVDRLRCIR